MYMDFHDILRFDLPPRLRAFDAGVQIANVKYAKHVLRDTCFSMIGSRNIFQNCLSINEIYCI